MEYAGSIVQVNLFDLCTTLESNRWYPEVMGESPAPEDRAYEFSMIPYKRKYITIEPIMDFDMEEFVMMISECRPIQVNIGADSGKNGLPEPSAEKVMELAVRLSAFTKVHHKSNLKRVLDRSKHG